ncbi:hypothetical protein [uncultured Subdoligranulum sp.]|uniref:hypothetical protein n=1 Tax=uncultured Subdoligranulum sp. TaxID=512298 RepID=UPI002628835E|nr:hypothetical protein [uncultured Subdoligranulum sp.]
MNRKQFIKKCIGIGYSKKEAEYATGLLKTWKSYDAIWLFEIAPQIRGRMTTMDIVKLCADAEKALKRGAITESQINKFMYYVGPFKISLQKSLSRYSTVTPEKIMAQRVVPYEVYTNPYNNLPAETAERIEKRHLLQSLFSFAEKYVCFSEEFGAYGKHLIATLWVAKEHVEYEVKGEKQWMKQDPIFKKL